MTEELEISLYEIPEPSTAIYSGVAMKFIRGNVELLFDYDREQKIFHSGIKFLKVRAYKYKAELYCGAYDFENAYDSLVEVTNSEWVNEFKKATPIHQKDTWILKHFKIYFDSSGCFEVIAESWELIPEQKGQMPE